jgi:hypothetical protein
VVPPLGHGRIARALLAAALCASTAAGALAQAPAAPPRVSLRPPDASVPLHRRPWIRPLASLLVPGAGQVLARQPRGVVYLATEVWLVARAVALTRDSRAERRHYRDLAYGVARRRFGVVRPEGPFSYYEEMGKYVESGPYDLDAGPDLVPETDTTTYNGAVWRLARETYFENPDSTPSPGSAPFLAAMRFYSGRAVTEPYRWSWRDARLEQDAYRASIRASDAAYQAATNYLGAVLLNHLLSAVDALVAVRLGRNGVLPHVTPGAEPGRAILGWHARF